MLGDVLVGTCEEILLSWWGPKSIPQGHILAEHEVNSIICQPEDEDTLLSDQHCTGWIKLLITSPVPPKLVADIYSNYGKYSNLQLKKTFR